MITLLTKIKFANFAFEKYSKAVKDRDVKIAKDWLDVYNKVFDEIMDEFSYSLTEVIELMDRVELSGKL